MSREVPMTAMSEMSEHEEIEALLAWHATGELDSAEGERVSAHLAGCEACCLALEDLKQMKAAIVEEPIGWKPDPGAFDRLRTQIAIEAPRRQEVEAAARSPFGQKWQQFQSWLDQQMSLPRWALAVQAMAMLVMALWAFGRPTPDIEPQYETLTSEASVVAADARAVLLVGFARSATEPEIRSLLLSQGARIVDGPSQIGIYSLALGDAPSLQEVLKRLRETSIVTLAEPISSLPKANERAQADPAGA